MKCEQSPEGLHTTEGWGDLVLVFFLFSFFLIYQYCSGPSNRKNNALPSAQLYFTPFFTYTGIHTHLYVQHLYQVYLHLISKWQKRVFLAMQKARETVTLQELQWNRVTIWLPHKVGISVGVHTCVHTGRDGEFWRWGGGHHFRTFSGAEIWYRALRVTVYEPFQNQSPTKTT